MLRRGRKVGGGKVSDLSTDRHGAHDDRRHADPRARRAQRTSPRGETVLELAALYRRGRRRACRRSSQVNLKVHAGEIVGIAGVSGNGQSELVEVLSGQRPLSDGRIIIKQKPFEPTRDHFYRLKIFGLPEEPLKNATVPRMTVAENMAFRTFDKPPTAKLGWWLSPGPMRAKARELIARYRVKTTVARRRRSPTCPAATCSAPCWRASCRGDVDVLIVANPCFGLDFASVAEIRAQIMEQRNRGAAVLLVSEDLDEILELADRVAVMSGGTINYVAPIGETDRATIGKHMAGH